MIIMRLCRSSAAVSKTSFLDINFGTHLFMSHNVCFLFYVITMLCCMLYMFVCTFTTRSVLNVVFDLFVLCLRYLATLKSSSILVLFKFSLGVFFLYLRFFPPFYWVPGPLFGIYGKRILQLRFCETVLNTYLAPLIRCAANTLTKIFVFSLLPITEPKLFKSFCLSSRPRRRKRSTDTNLHIFPDCKLKLDSQISMFFSADLPPMHTPTSTSQGITHRRLALSNMTTHAK